MSAEQAFAAIGRSVDGFMDRFTRAVGDLARHVQLALEQDWRTRHGGGAADALAEFPAYRAAVTALTQAAGNDTRTEMDIALLHGELKARAEYDHALHDLRHHLTTPHPEGGS